jgi:holo-[acyl-carrier protein] synthase
MDRFGDRFLHRVFTDGEIEYSMSMKFPARHLAARFAAKEAVSKAFGTGIGKAMGWRNIDIRKQPSGEPFLVFSGGAQELAAKRGVRSAFVTLSHSEHHAIACIVLDG